MKTPERFDRAIKALVKAYMNDTLDALFCQRCAVGNMCGGNRNWKYVVWVEPSSIISMDNLRLEWQSSEQKQALGREAIEPTGYNAHHLALVENAFLTCRKTLERLMAVVDVLCEIEGINDPAPYKEMFEGKELEIVNQKVSEKTAENIIDKHGF